MRVSELVEKDMQALKSGLVDEDEVKNEMVAWMEDLAKRMSFVEYYRYYHKDKIAREFFTAYKRWFSMILKKGIDVSKSGNISHKEMDSWEDYFNDMKSMYAVKLGGMDKVDELMSLVMKATKLSESEMLGSAKVIFDKKRSMAFKFVGDVNEKE